MNTSAAMKHLGEIDGKNCYWAEPGRFDVPGFYFWDGERNVHLPLDLLERCAAVHESINPACDHERQNGAPGAGAMGAIIEFRDAIRKLT